MDPTVCKANLEHSPSCAYTCVGLLAAHLRFSFSFQFFSFPFRLLALTKGCKGAEPWSWQDTFLFPCGFVFPSFLSGSLGNCAAFPVKSQPLPQDHTACYILTYFWSPLRTCFTTIPVRRAFILSFTHIYESVMMLYLSVVCNNDQLHIFGCPLRLPFMLRGKRQFNICWLSYLKRSHFLFKKRQAGRGEGPAMTPHSHCSALFFASMWANQNLLHPQNVWRYF